MVIRLFGKAFAKSSTQDKAVSGFRMCGLWPCDQHVFGDADFLAAEVTDEPEPVPAAPAAAAAIPVPALAAIPVPVAIPVPAAIPVGAAIPVTPAIRAMSS